MHTSSNFILSVCLLIVLDTLLLRPSLYCNTSLHFTALHPTTLHYTYRQGYFSWRPCIFMVISHSVRLRMRNVSDKSCRENPNSHFTSSNLFFFWKSFLLLSNVEKHCIDRQARYDGKTRRMRFACWITKATNIHSEYIIHFFCFPWQEWLRVCV